MNKDYLYYRELYHWGILGQRKGHRRFQNEDGSLTPEGRERYRKERENPKNSNSSVTSEALSKSGKISSGVNKGLSAISKSEKPLTDTSKELLNISKNIKTKPGKYVHKDYSDITDQDLQKRVNRLNLEKQYGQLTGDTKYVMSGSEKAREMLQTIGSVIAVGASSAVIFKTFYEIINSKKK